MPWFYFSYADDSGWLGGAYVEAEDDMSAYFKTTVTDENGNRINPGGEVMFVGPLPAEAMSDVKEEDRNRLLNREEVANGGKTITSKELG